MKKILVLLFALSFSANAFAVVHPAVKVLGGVNMGKPRVPNGYPDYSATSRVGGGGAFQLGIGNHFSLEVGALYIEREYSATVTVLGRKVTVRNNEKGIQIPLIARIWPVHFFNFGLGMQYTKYLGNIARFQKVSGSSSETGGQLRRAEAQQTDYDFGAVVALGFDIPLKPAVGLVLDARYVRGLKDIDRGASRAFMDDIQGWAGLRFGLGVGKKK